ncbi:MAG: hypothetical protein OXN17_22830 [Candidatus Poribacteria bacterium]|nr:hypothetical protein [Candidatus Poribacteria bacterium]MDE0503648.1 hypothetical protein [Candidatus Poribacteria bacterium]
MNHVKLILIGLILGFGMGTFTHTALAQKAIKLVADEDNDIGDRLSVAISENTVIVGSVSQNIATVFAFDGKNWDKQAELAPRPGGSVGWSVAASGDSLIIGVPHDDAGAENSGSAFVFVRKGKNWDQRAKLGANDPTNADNFGYSVAIDRNTAIVGVPRDDDAGRDSGSAYIFFREGVAWRKQAKLVGSDLAGGDTFGESVFIHGNTAVVGAHGHTHSGTRFAGAAYVFVRKGDQWTEQAKLVAADAAKADRFGSSVSMGGKTLVVGAPFRDSEGGTDSGAAYVFALDGASWKFQAKLVPEKLKKNLKFGYGVATTGGIVIVGAPGYDDPARGSGAAFSFVRTDRVWEQKATVEPEDGAKDIHFGTEISMSENAVAVASHSGPFLNHDGKPNGDGHAAYVYSSIEHFGTPPFAVDPFGLKVTTLARVKRTALLQNFPNPFNPETWIPYRLGADAEVSLHIYDVQGQLMRRLDLGEKVAGEYSTPDRAAYWGGRNSRGEGVSSGIYFYQLSTPTFDGMRRMVIAK